MPELDDHQFEIVGDSEALSDAFFDALAAVLLAAEGPVEGLDQDNVAAVELVNGLS